MKHYFIQQKHLPRLTLFFAGWGMDECPFMDYCPENSDLLVCYDYRSLDLWYCRIWTCLFVIVLL